jgi:thiosulfate/3-mercaptopyruvate sulfurtransferase
MNENISPIIQPVDLVQLFENKTFLLLDVRAGVTAEADYLHQHIAGAFWVDLNKSLAEIPTDFAKGGRHPLPSPSKFSSLLSSLGIQSDSHVIVYDDKSGANAAARCWWMLRSAGIENVQVLNGGMQAAEELGLPMRSGKEMPGVASSFKFDDWQLPIITMQEVNQMYMERRGVIIDVRDAYRYRGESEPIDLIAGHIPCAINFPFSENLDDKGYFLSPEILRSKYSEVIAKNNRGEVVVHCGSGVTACHTLLAMEYAGLPVPSLYVGSWSEWSRNGLPIEKNY